MQEQPEGVEVLAEADGEQPAAQPARKRSTTMSRKEMARDIRRRRLIGEVDPEEAELMEEIAATRPKTRADCVNGPRPCPYLSCAHHLAVSVSPTTGSVKLTWPDKELHEMEETCSLDLSDRGGITLEEVGSVMNLTRERVRQIETAALGKLRAAVEGSEAVDADFQLEARCPQCKSTYTYDSREPRPGYCGPDCGKAARRLVLLKGGK